MEKKSWDVYGTVFMSFYMEVGVGYDRKKTNTMTALVMGI